MTYGEIEATVKEILAKHLSMEPQKIALESRLVEDLGVDSFGSVEVAFELEEKFDLKSLMRTFMRPRPSRISWITSLPKKLLFKMVIERCRFLNVYMR